MLQQPQRRRKSLQMKKAVLMTIWVSDYSIKGFESLQYWSWMQGGQNIIFLKVVVFYRNKIYDLKKK